MRISDWSSDVCSSDLPLRVSSTGRLARQVPAIAVLAAVRPQLGASPPRLRLHQVLDGEARRGLVLVPLLGSAHPAPPLVVHTSSVPCPRTRPPSGGRHTRDPLDRKSTRLNSSH